MKQDKYIVMDAHQETTEVSVLDTEGKVIWETIVDTQAWNDHPDVGQPEWATARDVRRIHAGGMAL